MDRVPAMTVMDMAACKLSKYLAAVSPSCRSGKAKDSLLIANELDLDPCPSLKPLRSVPWRNLLRVRKFPRLPRPEVDVELRALPLRVGGVGGVTSSEPRPEVLIVEALSRAPRRRGMPMGDECGEGAEWLESFLRRGYALGAKGTLVLEKEL